MEYTLSSILSAPTPAAVLSLFQQAADAHARSMGVGFEALLKRGLLWVVTRIRYRILKMPAPNQAVEITTWPLPPSRLGFERNYTVTDPEGNLLIQGESLWVVIDTATRKLAAGGALYPQGDYRTDRPFAERARRLRDFEGTPAGCIVPTQEHIDRNGHVNNTHYAAFAWDAAGKPAVHAFQIDYIHEVLVGQPLQLYTADGGLVKGTDENGTVMFNCVIE